MIHLDDISCGYEIKGSMKIRVPMHRDDPVMGLSKSESSEYFSLIVLLQNHKKVFIIASPG